VRATGAGAAVQARLDIHISETPALAKGCLGAQGTPLYVVSEVLGHASIAITKDVYGHLVEGDKRAAAESMSGVLFGARTRGVAPSVAPGVVRKPLSGRRGASELARSEGLEPPTF
jgi:hypothetical protein